MIIVLEEVLYPAGQSTHTVAFSTTGEPSPPLVSFRLFEAYRPATQLEQLAFPCAEICPAPHGSQSSMDEEYFDEISVMYVPAGHISQLS